MRRATVAGCVAVLLATVAALVSASEGEAFDLDPLPPASGFTMNLNLGQTFMMTDRGGHTWNTLAMSALDRWNSIGIGPDPDRHFFASTQLNIAENLCAPTGVNQVVFADLTNVGVCTFTFEGSVAVTLTFFTTGPGGQRFESDVFVNACYPFGAYPGPLRPGPPPCDSSPSPQDKLYDIYRVLLHEFGHVIGLEHPDEAGQQVEALMNNTVTNVDDVRADDIAGARAINWRNPLPAAFVRNFYITVLGRTPSELEVDGWVAFLRANPTRADVIVHGFFQSPEFTFTRSLNLDGYIGVLYSTILLRSAGPAEVALWAPVVVSRFHRLVPGFVNSPEFQGVLRSTPIATVIRRFYQNVLGRTPSDAEVDLWVNALQQQGLSWVTVAQGFLGSPEYLSGSRTFAQHIEVLYRTFLGRTPSTPEVQIWLNALFVQLADVEAAFMGSPEFQSRIAALF